MNFWVCLTHECGSCNFNNLSRHEWEACDIRKKTGRPPSNTWHDPRKGGLNGDVSRKFYPDWERLCRERQRGAQKIENWKRQLALHEENIGEEI